MPKYNIVSDYIILPNTGGVGYITSNQGPVASYWGKTAGENLNIIMAKSRSPVICSGGPIKTDGSNAGTVTSFDGADATETMTISARGILWPIYDDVVFSCVIRSSGTDPYANVHMGDTYFPDGISSATGKYDSTKIVPTVSNFETTASSRMTHTFTDVHVNEKSRMLHIHVGMHNTWIASWCAYGVNLT